jgi:predicted metal-dependent peptidase
MTTSTVNKKESDKFKDLIGPMDTKLDKVVREMLITARVGLLLKASFFGNLATRLKLVNADEWCATAATDGRNFYYNSRFIKMLKPKEIEFLFGHEVLHCVYDHFGRRGSRDPQLFNIANDFAVNGDLVKHKVGEMITTVPCLFDRKYEGMSSEEIYDKLYEKAEKINISDLLDKMIDEHMDGEGDPAMMVVMVIKKAKVVPDSLPKSASKSVTRSKKPCWRRPPLWMVQVISQQVSSVLYKT